MMVLTQSDQVLHCQVRIIAEQKDFLCSLVYAGNKVIHRRELWQNLRLHNHFVANRPWVLLGDFNVSLNIEDSSKGSSSISMGMTEFKDCVNDTRIEDINKSGIHFTWNQRPKAMSGILKKLDRIMGNGEFISQYTNAYVFKPYRLSDHSPVILIIPFGIKRKHKPFKFANFVVRNAECHTPPAEEKRGVID